MVELKVRRIGNSLGVVLPKGVIARLNTRDGEPLYLTETPEGGYRVAPHDPAFEGKMAKAGSSAATAIRSTSWRSDRAHEVTAPIRDR